MSHATLVRAWIVCALALGGSLLAIAIVYWALPAEQVPTWLPGHKPSTHPRHGHHHKLHGLIAFALSFMFLIGAYLLNGERKPAKSTP
jgi:hypothetical protein